MSCFEIAIWVTWNSLPILPSIFGLSSQNIMIPHYPCHSVPNINENSIYQTLFFHVSLLLRIVVLQHDGDKLSLNQNKESVKISRVHKPRHSASDLLSLCTDPNVFNKPQTYNCCSLQLDRDKVPIAFAQISIKRRQL